MTLRLFSFAAATAVLGIAVTLFVRADDSVETVSDGDAAEESADNGLCYVCHLDLQKEAITTSHLGEDIGCTDCHGRSAEHMHDEMLMTKPDQLFGRCEVNDLCGTCHDDAHEDVEDKVAAFLNQWRGRDRPNGRVITEQSICTVPWDDAGAYLRFSVTYEAADEAAEDAWMAETKARLEKIRLVF